MDPREFEKKTQDELDDILNSALDELEDDEDFTTAGTNDRKEGVGDTHGIKEMEDEEEFRAAKTLRTLMDDFSNPEIAESLEKAFRQLGGHAEGEELLQESLKAAKAAEREEAERKASVEGSPDAADDKSREAPGGPSDTRAPAEDSAAARTVGAKARTAGAKARTGTGASAGVGAAPSSEYGFGKEGTDMDRTIFRTLEMLSKVRRGVA